MNEYSLAKVQLYNIKYKVNFSLQHHSFHLDLQQTKNIKSNIYEFNNYYLRQCCTVYEQDG